MEAAIEAANLLELNHDAALSQWQHTVELATYDAEKAERRYRAVEPLCCGKINVVLVM